MSQKMTITLLKFECVVPQEANGDEIVLMLNHQEAWNPAKKQLRMHPNPGNDITVSAFDFTNGTAKHYDDWQPIVGFQPADVVFEREGTTPIFQLLEIDPIGEDNLGEAVVSPDKPGEQVAEFKLSGAHYRLTYAVTVTG